MLKTTALLGGIIYSSTLTAQINLPNLNNVNLGEVHGNFQADAQYYQEDTAIGAKAVPEDFLFNGFANIIYTRGKFSAGIRYESYLNGLNGFPPGYKGSGIPYRYATYNGDALEFTVGNFYEQFGSGITLRAYEERNLGYDNAFDGFRVKYQPFKGLYLKGLVGKQRLYFSLGPGIVRGLDGELDINETFKSLNEKKWRIALGGSFVSKFQSDQDPTLVLPENVGNSAGRIRLSFGNFNVFAEYANKINDPIGLNQVNGYPVYKNGEAFIFNASYAQKGFALYVGANRIDNMNFRSDRNAKLNDLLINYTPPLCKQQTYSLLTIRPYSSQPNGEIEFTGQADYKVKKESLLGGKYGMDISVNFSGANGLDTTHLLPTEDTVALDGYKVNSYGPGKEKFFRDLYVEISKKFNKKMKLTLVYDYQEYNHNVIINGVSGNDFVCAHTVIADLTYKLKAERAVRIELQHLYTDQKYYKGDLNNQRGDWASGLIEFTVNSNWFIAVQDQWNYGNESKNKDDKFDKRLHYYNVTTGYTKNATRISLGYGRQRQGLFCVGGVCRQVPASSGVVLSITTSF